MNNLAGLTDHIKNITSKIDTIENLDNEPESVPDAPYELRSGQVSDEVLMGTGDDNLLAIQRKLRQLSKPSSTEETQTQTQTQTNSGTGPNADIYSAEAFQQVLEEARMPSLADFLRSVGITSLPQLAAMPLQDLVADGIRETVAKRLLAKATARVAQHRATRNDRENEPRVERHPDYSSQSNYSMDDEDTADDDTRDARDLNTSTTSQYSYDYGHVDEDPQDPAEEEEEEEEEDLTKQVKRGHWYRCWDETEQWPFYWHEITQETTWDPPPIFQKKRNNNHHHHTNYSNNDTAHSASHGSHRSTTNTRSIVDDEAIPVAQIWDGRSNTNTNGGRHTGPGTGTYEESNRYDLGRLARETREARDHARYREQKRQSAKERHQRQQKELQLRKQAAAARRRKREVQARRGDDDYNHIVEKQKAIDEDYYKDWRRLQGLESPVASNSNSHSGSNSYRSRLSANYSDTSASESFSDRSALRLSLDSEGKRSLKLRKHAQYKGRRRNPNQKTPAGGHRGRPRDYHFHDTSTDDESSSGFGNYDDSSFDASHTSVEVADQSKPKPLARWVPDEVCVCLWSWLRI